MSGAALRAGRRDIPTQLTLGGESAAPLVVEVAAESLDMAGADFDGARTGGNELTR